MPLLAVMVNTSPQQPTSSASPDYIPPLESGDRLVSTVSWFSLQDGEYVELTPNAAGIIQSQVFPGLWLDVSALVTGNMQQVLGVLQTGLNSGEHQKFVEELHKFATGDRFLGTGDWGLGKMLDGDLNPAQNNRR